MNGVRLPQHYTLEREETGYIITVTYPTMGEYAATLYSDYMFVEKFEEAGYGEGGMTVTLKVDAEFEKVSHMEVKNGQFEPGHAAGFYQHHRECALRQLRYDILNEPVPGKYFDLYETYEEIQQFPYEGEIYELVLSRKAKSIHNFYSENAGDNVGPIVVEYRSKGGNAEIGIYMLENGYCVYSNLESEVKAYPDLEEAYQALKKIAKLHRLELLTGGMDSSCLRTS